MANDEPPSSGTSINNTITLRSENHGVVVGTNTGVINKNYFGGDTYNHVQFYVLAAQGRSSGLKDLIGEAPEPYKFLSPYSALDTAIFKGRDDEVSQLIGLVRGRRLVVVTGEASVGKTSLLAAGVIPQLIDKGLMVLKIQEYADPIKTIGQALRAEYEHLRISLPETSSLVELIRAITTALEGTLVLVLDQFELLFESSISSQQRDCFIHDLAISLNEIRPGLLRVVIVIRDEAIRYLWEYQDQIPELHQCRLNLLSLDKDQAAIAITEPLGVRRWQVRFYGDTVQRLLVPGLAKLGSGDPSRVYPPYLQIVCSWLYRKSTETDPPRIIDAELLKDAKGADGIFAGYLEDTLETIDDERRLSWRILALMTREEVEKWVTPEQLHDVNPAIPITDTKTTLQILVRAGLLVKRSVDGKYAFTSSTIAEEVLRLAGPQAQRKERAEKEAERVWLSWLGRNAFASTEQLRYLASFGADLTPSPVKTMLLLRSAVERQQSPSTWLNLLNQPDGRALISELEGVPRQNTPAIRQSEMVLAKAEEVLELPPEGNPSTGDSISMGRIARNAASHSDPAVRQTCALALTAISDNKSDALGRLTTALSAAGNHLATRAELRGALADAEPKIEELNRSLLRSERIAIWSWRARRRIVQDRYRWLVLMLGGAVGAGAGVGVMRFVIAALGKNDQPGIQFGMYFYYSFILGGSLALGMSLAKPLLLRESALNERGEVMQDPSLSTLTTPLAVITGGIFFGLAHILTALINGLSITENPLIGPLGFVAGLGVSLSIAWFHRISSRVSRWVVAIVCAMAVWSIIQLVFNFTAPRFDDISIINTGEYYQSHFRSYPWWSILAAHLSNQLINAFSIFDAALAAACLTVGMLAGLTRARRHLNLRAQRKATLE